MSSDPERRRVEHSSSSGADSGPSSASNMEIHDSEDEAKSDSTVQEQQLDASMEPQQADQKHSKVQDRRRRHRENMVRYRRKKKATVEEMKSEEQFLAAQLHSMLDLHAAESQTYHRHFPSQRGVGDDENVVASGHYQQQQQQDYRGLVRRHGPTAMDAFVSVLTEKERLHHENAALRHNLSEHHRSHQALQDILDDEEGEDEEKPRPGRHAAQGKFSGNNQQRSDSGRWVKFLPEEVPLYYTPLTEDECSAYAAKTLASVFIMQSTYLSGGYRGAHVVTLFDWTASLLLDFDDATQMPVIRYEFKKTFRRSPRTVEQLVASQWKILHSSSLYQTIHRVPVKSKVLQKVNDNLSVVMWNAPEPEQSVRYRNVSVFSRTAYENPEGHMYQVIGMTGVPLKVPEGGAPASPAVTTAKGEPVVYVTSGFMYTMFGQSPHQQGDGEEEEENEINVAFGGYALLVNEDQGRFLMVELGGTCVRLEHQLFPFRVLR